MKLSFTINPLPGDSELKKQTLAGRTLRQGDRLDGTVVDIKNNGKVLVDFGNFRALAEIHFPVAKGEILNLIVYDVEKQLLLGLQDRDNQGIFDSGKGTAKLESLGPDDFRRFREDIQKVVSYNESLSKKEKMPERLINTLKQLGRLTGPLKIEGDTAQLASDLKFFTENTGIYFEKNLEKAVIRYFQSAELSAGNQKPLFEAPGVKEVIQNDLKPHLYELKHLLEGKKFNPGKSVIRALEGVAAKIDQMIENITGQQHSAVNKMMVHRASQKVTYSAPITDSDVTGSFKFIKNVTKLISILETFSKKSQLSTDNEITREIENLLETARRLTQKDQTGQPETRNRVSGKLKPGLVLLNRLFQDIGVFAENTDSKDIKDIKQSVEKLLSGMSVQPDPSTGKLPQAIEPSQVFTFALPFREDLEKGKLRIYYPAGKTRDSQSGFRISLLLAMARIGEVRTDFYYYKKNLDITFFVKNDEIKSFFQNRFEKVRAPLQTKFNTISLNVSVSEEKIDAFDYENVNAADTGKVDLRI